MVMISSSQATVVIRFLDRSLLIQDNEPGITTRYTVSLTYNNASPTLVGSLDMLFCIDPIPTNPCVPPPGLNVAGATLAAQTGETGYSITTRTSNHLVLGRTPVMTGSTPSQYVLENVVNPTYDVHSYSIRLSNYATNDASGPLINLGSVVTQIQEGVFLETQVPPILVFCVAQQVGLNCNSTNGVHYVDLGEVDTSDTLTATSQMAIGTNASGGYDVTVYGSSLVSGMHEVTPLSVPTLSAPGNTQFGINLRENSQPAIGSDPDGDFANANPSADYGTPNLYKYQNGDVVASAPNVSLIRRFTVSYIVNVAPSLRAGVYSTTLTYICTGRF